MITKLFYLFPLLFSPKILIWVFRNIPTDLKFIDCISYHVINLLVPLKQNIFLFFKFNFIYFNWRLNYFTILYWFCYISWIHHGCTRVPHPEPHSHQPPCTIPLGHPSAPAPSILYPESNLDWRFVSYIVLYRFQCHSPKSSHPLPLPQSPKDCSMHLCLFCCLTYRVIVTIFLNSIYMR